MDLSALLGRGMVDHLALAERVLQQVIEQVAGDESIVAGGETTSERIATALGNRLARLILEEDASLRRGRYAVGRDAALTPYDELVERNIVVASALGACDCWGDNAHCPICDGEGAPGWLPPDPELFATYVRPAARTVTQPIHPSAGGVRRASTIPTTTRNNNNNNRQPSRGEQT